MIKRPGLIETDRKSKINLTGALINRSPLKNTENSSMISNTSFSSDTACENHPNKRGKYMVVTDEIEDDEQTYYCQKCAILLASKGFEVKKLEYTEQRTAEKKKINPREQQLSNFVRGISQKITVLQENKRDAAQQLSDIEDNYQDKVQKVEQFFQELYITLERHKNKEVHEISLRKKAAEQELATYLGYVTEKVELLETMKQDIVSSHDSIVKDTPEQDYQLVMSHYQTTISQLKFEPAAAVFSDSALPSVETIENVLAQLFQNGRSSSYFSFDSSKKNYE